MSKDDKNVAESAATVEKTLKKGGKKPETAVILLHKLKKMDRMLLFVIANFSGPLTWNKNKMRTFVMCLRTLALKQVGIHGGVSSSQVSHC